MNGMTGAEARQLAAWAHADQGMRRCLFALMMGWAAGEYTPLQTAWALTHLPPSDNPEIATWRRPLVDFSVATSGPSLRRLALTLLARVKWGEDDVRTSFLDFCLLHLADPTEAVGIRALCIKLAFAQCRHWPELRAELRQYLTLMQGETLKPGLASVRQKTLKLL